MVWTNVLRAKGANKNVRNFYGLFKIIVVYEIPASKALAKTLGFSNKKAAYDANNNTYCKLPISSANFQETAFAVPFRSLTTNVKI